MAESPQKNGQVKVVKERKISIFDPKSPGALTLDELVQCGICLDTLMNPRMLPCQHTFCHQCLKDVVTRKPLTPTSSPKGVPEDAFNCPLCNLKVPLENGAQSLDLLPKNLYIDSLLNFINNSGEASPTKGPGSFTRKCLKCQTVLQLHDQSCIHCKQPFCKSCWIEHADKQISKLPGLAKQLEEAETGLNHRAEAFETRYDQLKSSIHAATEAQILDIKVKEETVLEEVDKIIGNEQKEYELLQEKMNRTKDELNKAKEEAERTSTDKTEEDSEETPSKDETQNQKIITFMTFHKATEKLLSQISRWGEMQVIFDAENFKLEQQTDYSPIEEEEQVQNGSAPAKNPLESIETLTTFYKSHLFYPKLVWNKCPRPTGLGIPPWADNHLYIAANETKVVLVLDRNTNKVIGRLSCPEMLCAHSVAFSEKRKETYVTDKWKHCIHVFASSGDFLRSLSSRGVTDGKLISPEGIATGPNDELVVCDTGNNRILVLEPEGGQQMAVIGRVKRKTEFHTPTSTACFGDRIVVADCGSNRVKVFNYSGEKLYEFGSLGKNKGQFRSPETVFIDPLGFILVGDCGNGRLQVFTILGDFVRVLGRPGEGPGKFKWISGLTVSKKMEIITADHKNRSIQIF